MHTDENANDRGSVANDSNKVSCLNQWVFEFAASKGQADWIQRFSQLCTFKEKVGCFGHANYHMPFLQTNVCHPYFLFMPNGPSQEGHYKFLTWSKDNPGVF
jgi:hypothetical protein